MLTNTIKTTALGPGMTPASMGIFIKRGGGVVADTFFTYNGSTQPEFCKWIRAGSSGDLIVENQDGVPLYFPNLVGGEWVMVVGQRVLGSATVPIFGAVTTTPAMFPSLTWWGGE